MTASLDLIWQQARQGQAEAIAHLMNRTLQAKGVRALVRRQGDCLQIMFEAARSLPPHVCAAFVCRGLRQLAPKEFCACGSMLGWLAKNGQNGHRPLTYRRPYQQRRLCKQGRAQI